MIPQSISVQRGKVLVYRVFDVGDDVDLSKASEVLRKSSSPGPQRFKLQKEGQQAILMSNDALGIVLGRNTFVLHNHEFQCTMTAKIWDFGTISLTYSFELPPQYPMTDLLHFAHDLQNAKDLYDHMDQMAQDLATQLRPQHSPLLQWDIYEDYIVYFIQEFSPQLPIQDTKTFLSTLQIGALLLGENKEKISPLMLDNILKHTFQYSTGDLAVIDWNSALIIEPSGVMDIPDVLEFALNQLLEMRFYDNLLDRKLGELYSSIIQKKNNSIFQNSFASLAEEAAKHYLEISEVVERVENSLKVVGDFYYSIIFRAASKRFRFKDWQVSIDQKLNNLAEISKLLSGGINEKRGQLMEIIIVLLITFECIPLVISFFKSFSR